MVCCTDKENRDGARALPRTFRASVHSSLCRRDLRKTPDEGLPVDTRSANREGRALMTKDQASPQGEAPPPFQISNRGHT